MTEVSVIVPVKDEAENIGELLQGIFEACAGRTEFEIIVVDDGSTDESRAVVQTLQATMPGLRLMRHRHSAGQSAAVHTGVLAARGAIICTLDGDGQNPPSQLPKLFTPFLSSDAPADLGLVAGQRLARQDTLSKKLASRAANSIRGAILQDGTRDTGCGLKGFRREAFLALPYFNHMHRYLPALFQRNGWQVTHVDVTHAPRTGGRSKYSNLQRALVGIVDLLGVAWLLRRSKSAVILPEQEGK